MCVRKVFSEEEQADSDADAIEAIGMDVSASFDLDSDVAVSVLHVDFEDDDGAMQEEVVDIGEGYKLARIAKQAYQITQHTRKKI